jgi:hypothetical protein
MVKLANLELYLVWMGRVESEVVKLKHSENFKHFSCSMVGAYEKKNDRKLCQDYWASKWKCKLANGNNELTFHLFYFHFLLEVMSQSIVDESMVK